jgi:hypothetical protein
MIFINPLACETVMTRRAIRNGRLSTKANLAPQGLAAQPAELRSVEAALIEAHETAEMIEEPILAFFIAMAIAEVGARITSQEGRGLANDNIAIVDPRHARSWRS